MRLDRHCIVIRERGLFDQFDLALCVIRVYALPLAIALAVGVAPAMAFNAWLFSDMPPMTPDDVAPFAYLWCLLVVTVWEIPLVTAPITLFLGEAVFQDRPKPRELVMMFFWALPQLFWYQVLLRALYIPFVFTWFWPFAARPYLNEVILLERTPWRRRRGNREEMTTSRRSAALHGGDTGDLFARWLASMGVGAVLFLALWVTMNIVEGLLFNTWQWSGATYTVYYPVAIWIVVGYFAVARFLGYLDLRIRREGWEIELLMRAEGARLTKELA
jgi:hypothetical protein